jgi:hypothetical protein
MELFESAKFNDTILQKPEFSHKNSTTIYFHTLRHDKPKDHANKV